MVRFSAAFIEQRPSAGRWGLVYGLTLGALLWTVQRLVETSRADAAAFPLMVLVASGWVTLHALWMWLALTASPARRTARRHAGFLGIAGLLIAAMAITRIASPSWRIGLPAGSAGTVTLLVLTALLGVVLLVAGGILVARRERHVPASYEDDEDSDIADAIAQRNAEAQPSLRERRHPGTVVMVIGAGLVIIGAFGAAIAAGPAPVKIICGAALAFVAFQGLRYLVRRRT